MAPRTIVTILVAVALAAALGFTTAMYMSAGDSGDGGGHTMSNGQTMTGGMDMGGP